MKTDNQPHMLLLGYRYPKRTKYHSMKNDERSSDGNLQSSADIVAVTLSSKEKNISFDED